MSLSVDMVVTSKIQFTLHSCLLLFGFSQPNLFLRLIQIMKSALMCCCCSHSSYNFKQCSRDSEVSLFAHCLTVDHGICIFPYFYVTEIAFEQSRVAAIDVDSPSIY